MGGAADWLVAGSDPDGRAVSRVTLPVPRLPLVVRLGRVGGTAPRLAELEEVVAARSLTVEEILATGGKAGRVPALWDGRAAPRIRAALERHLGGGEAGAGVA